MIVQINGFISLKLKCARASHCQILTHKLQIIDIEFIVNEDLSSWTNLYKWFTSIADPDGFEQRDHSRELQQNKHFSDATLTVLSALNNPIVRIQYKNVFPLTMSDIQFDTKLSADSIITCSATFRYQSYVYLPA